MSTVSRERFAEVVRAGGAAGDPDDVRLDLALAYLSAEVLPDEDATDAALDALVARTLSALDTLADGVPGEGRDDVRLRAVLGEFSGGSTDYDRLESSLLPDVLRDRRGLPILLSTVRTEVARRAGVPLQDFCDQRIRDNFDDRFTGIAPDGISLQRHEIAQRFQRARGARAGFDMLNTTDRFQLIRSSTSNENA